MYLVGNFRRDYFEVFENKNPMPLVFFKLNISQKDLISAKNDDEYQVVNLSERTYYDPKSNKWIPIEITGLA